MTEERRASPRRAAFLAAEIETSAGKSSIAITRDVSENGLLAFSRRELALGETIKVRLVRGQDVYEITGKVVRQEPLSPEESTLWRTKVGLLVEDTAQLRDVLAAVDRTS